MVRIRFLLLQRRQGSSQIQKLQLIYCISIFLGHVAIKKETPVALTGVMGDEQLFSILFHQRGTGIDTERGLYRNLSDGIFWAEPSTSFMSGFGGISTLNRITDWSISQIRFGLSRSNTRHAYKVTEIIPRTWAAKIFLINIKPTLLPVICLRLLYNIPAFFWEYHGLKTKYFNW